MMNSQASDHASSSSMGGSGGTTTVSQEFLSMEDHLENLQRNFMNCFDESRFIVSFVLEGISEAVENFSKDVGAASDGSQIPETLDKYGSLGLVLLWFLKDATPLHLAVLMDDRAMVQIILQSGKVDVNAEAAPLLEGRKYTALHLAMCGENVDIVKNLLGYGATINIGDDFFQRGGLEKLAKHDVIFKMIFEELSDSDVGFPDGVGRTALHHAAMAGTMAIVEYLVARHIDVHLRDGEGRTALHFAAKAGAKPIVEYLMALNVDINLCDNEGKSALHFAANKGGKLVVEYLAERMDDINLQDNKGRTPLHFAAKHGAKPIVEYLVKRKVDINLRDKEGRTALHWAAKKGEKHVVEYLVKRDVQINLCDNKGKTALHHAARFDEESLVECLVERNVDINLCDSEGRTALHIAAKEGAESVVEYLLGRKVDICLPKNDHRNNLQGPATERVKYFADYIKEKYPNVQRDDLQWASPISNSIDVQIQDNMDKNALHYAVEAYALAKRNIGIVKRLRENDVDMNARNIEGHTPFYQAVLGEHTEVVKELLLSKGRINIMEECDGKTPIQIAYENKFEHIKRALLECDDVSRYMDSLYRDRQVYVDAANAILVGAALIASVTFASWLQPPLGYTPYFGESYANSIPTPSNSDLNYVDVQHNKLLRGFWVFNCLSFYFAIATVVFGARSVLPRSRLFIKETVEKLRLDLLVTSILFACAVSFVIVAFGIAGCIVLTPMLKFQWYMIGPTIFGGIVCLGSLAFLFKSMLENNLRKESGSRKVK